MHICQHLTHEQVTVLTHTQTTNSNLMMKRYGVHYLHLHVNVHAVTQQVATDPLAAFLKAGGRQVHVVAGDGNCMFRSLSHQLYGSSERHFVVRSLLLRFESKNCDTFSQLLTKVNNIQTHIQRLILPGIWGTHVELHAAATFRSPSSLSGPLLATTSGK